MRFAIAVPAALFAGAFVAHFLLRDRGLVVIGWREYVLETSVPVLLMALVVLYAAVRGAVALYRAPRRLGEALAARRERVAGGRLTQGLIRIAEGDWRGAERLLTRGLKASDAPLANYLLAARAADRQGAPDRRDRWLALAAERVPDAGDAVKLTEAELALDAGDAARALAALAPVLRERPEHPAALVLAARAHRARGDRDRLLELLPRLAHARLGTAELEAIAGEALDAGAASELTEQTLDALWRALPAALRAAPPLVAKRALALDRLGRGDDAERELKAALKRDWQTPLVEAYGEVRSSSPGKQLRQAEAWLEEHPEDAALLTTAAKLCIANELWGKALSYLESSLAIAPSADGYALYGRLLGQLGETERAALAFRSGLKLASSVPLDAPALAAPTAAKGTGT